MPSTKPLSRFSFAPRSFSLRAISACCCSNVFVSRASKPACRCCCVSYRLSSSSVLSAAVISLRSPLAVSRSPASLYSDCSARSLSTLDITVGACGPMLAIAGSGMLVPGADTTSPSIGTSPARYSSIVICFCGGLAAMSVASACCSSSATNPAATSFSCFSAILRSLPSRTALPKEAPAAKPDAKPITPPPLVSFPCRACCSSPRRNHLR